MTTKLQRTHGAPRGLQGADLDEYNRLAHKRPNVIAVAELLEDGSMRMLAITPSELRAVHKSGAPRIAAYRGAR